MAAEPIVEPIVEAPVLWLVPDTIPLTDVPIEWPFLGPRALWDDVYGYGRSIVRYFGRHTGGDQFVMTSTLDDAIDSAVGSTVKALSGFINQAAQLAIDAQNWTSMQLDALDANIGAIYGYFDSRIGLLEGFQWAVTRLALPSLQAQIDELHHLRSTDFQFNSAADRAWAMDNIYRPLHENIGQVASAIPVWSEGAYERARNYADDAVGVLGTHTLAQLVPLTLAVRALETESEECVKPMCETLGPKTDLGKLLKGAKIAAELAALTAILSMDAGDIAGLIHAVTSRLSTVVDDVEQFLGPGGETVAGLIAAATGDLV